MVLEQALNMAGQLVQGGSQGAILQTVAMAQMLHTVDAECSDGLICFFLSPLGVLLSRGPLRGSFHAPRAVAHEGTDDLRAGRGKLQDQAAAPQHFVVVMGCQHEDAASHRRLGRGRRQRPLVTRHGTSPVQGCAGSRTGRTGL